MSKVMDKIYAVGAVLLVASVFIGIWWMERHLPCWMYEARNAPVHCLPGGGR